MSQFFDGKRAYDHIVELAVKIGPRLCGTDREKAAIDYVHDCFKSFGLQPVIQSFKMASDKVLESRLEIIEPALGEFRCMQQLGTKNTPPEGVTGELVFVEGTQEPQVGPHITGKIVVLVGSPISNDRRNVLKYNPLAVLSVGSTIGSEPNTFHLVLKDNLYPYESAPVLFITYEDTLKLFNSNARLAKVTVRSTHEMGESHNVIAEVKGSDFPEQIVVIGGHIDSVPMEPGATDNAAGVATIVELARLYAEKGSKRTLRFAAWGSEEQSGGGAMTYVHRLKKQDKEEKNESSFMKGISKTELDNHLMYINLDVLGMSLGHNGCHVDGLEEMGNYIKALSCELGVPHEIRTDVYGSDNISFFSAGVPALSFARLGTATQHMHTVRDTIDLISVPQMEIIGRFLDVFISRTTAEGYLFPFKRQVPDEKLAMIKSFDTHMRAGLKLIGEEPLD